VVEVHVADPGQRDHDRQGQSLLREGVQQDQTPAVATGRVPICQVSLKFLMRVSQVAVLATVMDSSSGSSGLLMACLLIG
jgi:hypothetical protein